MKSLIHNVSVAALICALVPLLMARYSNLFPEKLFLYEVSKCI